MFLADCQLILTTSVQDVQVLLDQWMDVQLPMLILMAPLLMSTPVFCYLGEMLCAGGGCELAIAYHCCVAWEIQEAATHPVLQGSGLCIISVCVRSAMLQSIGF